MIKFSTDYNEPKTRRLLAKLIAPKTPKIFPLAALIFSLALLIIVLCTQGWKGVDLPLILMLSLLCLLQSLGLSMLLRAQAVAAYRIDGKRNYTVDQDGISYCTPLRRAHIRWSAIQKSGTEGDHFYLLDREGSAVICRISQISPQDFQTLRTLAAANSKPAS